MILNGFIHWIGLLHAHIDQLFIFIELQSLNDILKFSRKKVDWLYEMNNYLFPWETLGFFQKLVGWNHEMTDVVTPHPLSKKGGKKKKKTIIKGHAPFHPLPNKCIFFKPFTFKVWQLYFISTCSCTGRKIFLVWLHIFSLTLF